MATDANQDLSLGKLRRATDPANVSADNTANSKLGSDAADTTSANSNVSMSDFSISSVDAVTGNAYVDEGTSETYTINFSDAGARFTSRILGHKENFSWSGSTELAPTANQDYTAVASAPAITTSTPGGADSVITDVGVTFAEDGQSDGFNDHATNYNSKRSKEDIEVVDTYGASVVCFLPGTKVGLAGGGTKNIEDLTYDDKLLSLDIEGMPDEDDGYVEWKSWTTTDMKATVAECNVEKMWFDYTKSYYTINPEAKNALKITPEHDILVRTGEVWSWKKPAEIVVGDYTWSSVDGKLIRVDAIEKSPDGNYECVHLDVEPFDVYFVNGFLAHNKGTNTAPPTSVSVSDGATSIGTNGFTARGSVNPRGSSTTCTFKVYSDTGMSTLVKTVGSVDAGSGTSVVNVTGAVTGLTNSGPESNDGNYWYKMEAQNSGGTQVSNRSAIVQCTN